MKKSIFFGITALVLGLGTTSVQAKTVCNLYINNPPTNVRPWASKDNTPVHTITEPTYLDELSTNGEWSSVEVWIKEATYIKGWIHNSQFERDCFEQDTFSDAYWQYYDIADKAKQKGDFNTALINYNRAKAEFLRLNQDKLEGSDELEGLILLMEQKR
jgi:hypothetical protein